MNRKRSIQIAVVGAIVIVGVVVLLLTRGCRDSSPKGRPVVIELTIETSDELPISITVDHGPELADEMVVDPDSDQQLLVGPALVAAIKKGAGDNSIKMPDSVTELEGIAAVIIERIRYKGQGRDGVVTRIRLESALPEASQREVPDKVAIGLDESNAAFYDVIPWPRELSWSVEDDKKLKVVSGDTVLELAAGQSGKLAAEVAEIPVTIEEVDDEADIPDGDDVKLPTVKRDLGKVKFTSAISIRYLGRLKIAEDKE